MAYSTSNPPRLLSQSVGAGSGAVWYYASADAQTAVRVAGYVTNGYDLGIRAGDIMLMVDTGTFAAAVLVCNASTSASTDFTDGLAIVATDTD